MERNASQRFAITKQHGTERRLAYPRGFIQKRVKYRIEVTGRAGNHLEDFRTRLLLLKRFGELAIALRKLLSQAVSAERAAVPRGPVTDVIALCAFLASAVFDPRRAPCAALFHESFSRKLMDWIASGNTAMAMTPAGGRYLT